MAGTYRNRAGYRRPQPDQQVSFWSRVRPIGWFLLKLGGALSAIGFVVLLGLVSKVKKDMPSLDGLLDRQPETTALLDKNGIKFGEIGEVKHVPIAPEDLPRNVVNAAVAAEDHRFYSHHGVDFKGIIRAGVIGLAHGRFSQGGSTITQQVVKCLVLKDRSKNLWRKFREAVVAIELEKRYTKDQIMWMYLNLADYGNGRLGIETGANYNFGKTTKDLSLAEIAELIGSHPSPEKYSPRKKPEAALVRGHLVLGSMLGIHAISQAEYDQAMAERPVVMSDRPPEAIKGQEIVDQIRKDLEEEYGSMAAVNRLGFRYQTTIDIRLQALVKEYGERGAKNIAARNPGFGQPEVTIIVMDTHTGEVLAESGGNNYKPGGTNRANSRRQTGSVFKGLFYGAAIESKALDPYTEFTNSEVTFVQKGSGDWTPHNYKDEKTDGARVTVLKALAESMNTVAAKAICNVGVEIPAGSILPMAQCWESGLTIQTVEFTEKLGIDWTKEKGVSRKGWMHRPSLVLGALGVTPLALLNAYRTFGNDGLYSEPVFFTKILGQDAPNPPNREPKQVMDERTAKLMQLLLKAVVEEGTGRRARGVLPEQAYGKTGTTNNSTNAWFVGFTASYAAIVQVGHDQQNLPLGKSETGASAALPIWIAVMQAAYGRESDAERTLRQQRTKPRPEEVEEVGDDGSDQASAGTGTSGEECTESNEVCAQRALERLRALNGQ